MMLRSSYISRPRMCWLLFVNSRSIIGQTTMLTYLSQGIAITKRVAITTIKRQSNSQASFPMSYSAVTLRSTLGKTIEQWIQIPNTSNQRRLSLRPSNP